MTYKRLLEMLGEQGFFDLASVVQLAGERRDSIRMQLYRWCKAGKLLPLRRGMYAFPDEYNRKPVSPAELANRLYAPSYLSTYWALGYFGLIPELVVTYTSVTSRGPKTFSNSFGVFTYQHIKPSVFFGYRPIQMDGRRVLLAEPEKALLDLWHFGKGSWHEDRMVEMRFQNLEMIKMDKLREYAARFNSPRLSCAVEQFPALLTDETEGAVEL